MTDREPVSAAAPPPAAPLPLAIVMLSLNEAHNMPGVLDNLEGFAAEIHLVDSGSRDRTVEIARARGVSVVVHPFEGFGAQWNFALETLPVSQPYTMKLDPDERLTERLKANIRNALREGKADGFVVQRRLWFMGRPLGVRRDVLRIWRTGTARFTEVAVNEHPIVEGPISRIAGEIEHHDSPDLHHWFDKQNRYSTAEARAILDGDWLGAAPRLFGTAFERRMWRKAVHRRLPFRHLVVFLHCYLALGAWRAGKIGLVWSRLRADHHRIGEYKLLELRSRRAGRPPDGQAT